MRPLARSAGYKDVDAVVDVVARAGIATKVARLKPVAVVKGGRGDRDSRPEIEVLRHLSRSLNLDIEIRDLNIQVRDLNIEIRDLDIEIHDLDIQVREPRHRDPRPEHRGP